MEVSGQIYPGEIATGTYWTGGCVAPRAVLDAVVKGETNRPYRESNPCRPARSVETMVNELSVITIYMEIQKSRTGYHCYLVNHALIPKQDYLLAHPFINLT